MGRDFMWRRLPSKGGIMRGKTFVVLALALAAAFPAAASEKKKKQPDRGMLEKMEAVPCGAKQRGLNGLGAIWASAGITHVNSDEKLCPQYLLRADDMEYEIRPTEKKHPVLLAVGQEAVFKVKKDRMSLKVPEGDKKTRDYQIVAMKPAEVTAENPSPSSRPEKP